MGVAEIPPGQNAPGTARGDHLVDRETAELLIGWLAIAIFGVVLVLIQQ